MRRKLNRLLALLLCALMLSSECTGLLTAAQAAPAAPARTAPLSETPQTPETPEVPAGGMSEAELLAAIPSTGSDTLDFEDDLKVRPNLFVHFLGDNYHYKTDQNTGTGVSLGDLPVPAAYDQSKETNATAADNTWARYRDPNGSGQDMVTTEDFSGQVIFWVGLGVDRREVFELLQEDSQGQSGLTSLEAGFYYDSTYIEPYYGPDQLTDDAAIQAAYREVITKANIKSDTTPADYPANALWSADYEILRAETGMDPATDPITREEVTRPSFDEIVENTDGNWKMTYVSLELKDPGDDDAQRRLAGAYTGAEEGEDGSRIVPEPARGTGLDDGEKQVDSDYQYLLLIPFRLKRYNAYPNQHTLRLVRDATHLSIGAGAEGEERYAAWERITTRNPGKDLKLLTRFNGDLYLFGQPTGSDRGEVPYTATLYIDQNPSVMNTVELAVDGDPAVWPVKATAHQEQITGLHSGLGMVVRTDPAPGYTVTLTVKYHGADGTYIIHPYTVVTANREYTFTMPQVPAMVKDVEVHIGFTTDNPQYHVFLSELTKDKDGAFTDTAVLGNSAAVTTNLDTATDAPTENAHTIHSYDPPYEPHPTHLPTYSLNSHAEHPGPMAQADVGKHVRIDVTTHHDYQAVVRVGQFDSAGTLVTNWLSISATGGSYTTSPDGATITLPYGGSVTLNMVGADLDVEIVYQPADRYKATLEIYHDADVEVTDQNTAQLAYLVYDQNDEGSTAYSGVGYHLKTEETENHRAVKGDGGNKKLPWIAAAQATMSGSLAGDAERAPRGWSPGALDPDAPSALCRDAVMSQLKSAASLTAFATGLSALDLNAQEVISGWTGLRKDLQGQSYGDGDVAQFKGYLWELKTRIARDTTTDENGKTLAQLYDKTVTDPADGSTLYSYLDLTTAQVQAYILDILRSQEIDRANQRQYDEAYQRYLVVRAQREALAADTILSGMEALSAPIPPDRALAVTTDGVRTFQGEDYQYAADQSGNYLNRYYDYLDGYAAYLDEVEKQGTLNGVTPPDAAPAAAALQKIPLRTNNEAEAMLGGYLSAFAAANPVDTSLTIETREDRTVWVVLEGDSAYYVKSVQLFEVNGANESTTAITNVTPVKDPNYANVWRFTMPRRDCAVRVTYARRDTRELMVRIEGANGEEENVASVAAYRFYDHDLTHYPDELTGRTAPVLDKITNLGHQSESPYPPVPAPGEADERYIYNVFIGGTVTVRVKAKEGYTTRVMVENLGRGDSLYLTKGTTLDPREGDLYTFKVEDTGYANDTLRVTVTYIQQRDQYNAHIRAHPVPGEEAALGNEARWRIENPGPPPSVNHASDMPAYVGDHLVGDITVAPGYYIYGIAARGASGSYSFTYTGNGYNNGYGADADDPVKVYVDMPDEELWVEVYFKKVTDDAPESEPHYALTLTAKDPDNKTPYAANYAKATVYQRSADGAADKDSTEDFTLGEVGLASGHGDGTMTQTGFARTGQWVKVEANVAEGYCLSKVTVGPGDLGVAVTWEDEHSVSFYMPAGSVGVCVEFAKLEEGEDPPAHALTVRETWDPADPAAASAFQSNNYVRTASSDTIQDWNFGPVILVSGSNPERIPGADAGDTARGAAESGEEVTLVYQVDEANDWYIQSIILFSEGAATRLTDFVQEVTDNPHSGVPNFPYPAPAGTKYYKVTFRMPSSDAEFVIHYRQAADAHTSYPLTMVLYDPDNVAETKDDNRLSAAFSGFAGVTHPGVTLGQALSIPLMNDVRYLHPGDQVTLETQLQEGYAVDYLIIDPASLGLYPAWQSTSYDPATGVTRSTATFTMPNEGVAVLARYVKGSPHRYTANLILHPPAGYKMDDVGQGTFSTAGGGAVGSLTDYHKNAVYSTTQVPGTAVGYDLCAYDGFYIQRVTIEPAAGSTAGLSGSTGYQDGSFLMPAANVNINVYFQKGWPDEIQYDLTLEVQDPTSTGSCAAFRSVGANALSTPDSDKVYGGQSKTLPGVAYDNDVVVVDVTPAGKGYYNSGAVSVTDSDGNALAWWYVPGGIAFTMPPRSTKVVITFKDREDDPDDWRSCQAKLVVLNGDSTDTAKLDTTSATAAGNPLTYNGVDGTVGTITQLYPQDLLTLTAQPGAGRHIEAVYAVYTVGGDTDVVPIYQADAAGHLAAPPVEAGFIPGTPGDPAQAVSGLLAMPNADVTVYVRFAEGTIDPSRKWISLKVSGAQEAGRATADFDGNNAIAPMTVYPPTATGLPPLLAPVGAAVGMDTRFTSQGQEVTVTFEPATGYDIIKLEVYDASGRAVPYQWLSVTQDPPDLPNTNTWPNPPTDPDPGISHPGWAGIGARKIQLTVPEGCVTVHVTYGKVSDQPFRVQVVVNDPYPATPADPSQNNAWVIDPADQLRKKLREAKPGEWITLDLSVHPGYQVEYIKVIPQSYGLAPALPLPPIYSQSTGFYMPNGDCTVYVKFTRDTTATKIATVVAVGAPTNNPAANYVTIQSPLNTARLHAPVGGSIQSVPARPTVDWITVDYYWAANASVQSIIVQTQDGTDVPYTQTLNETGHGRISLPMPLKDLLVTVIYQASSQPPGQEVVLHVIDKDQRAKPTSPPIRLHPDGVDVNYGRLQAVYSVSADTGCIGPDSPPAETEYEGVSTIWVPAGERVNVFANSEYANGVYIDAAFVLYEAGGQMLNMNLQPDVPGPGFSGKDGPKESSFVVHQGRNDVYVLLTRKAPIQTEYAAVLMLRGPEDDSGQAGIAVGPSYTNAVPDQDGNPRRDGLPQANHGYAYVTADQGEHITVNVVPAAGYAIDYVQVTPLGYPLSYDLRSADSTITFDMPHCNVAITVYLKRATQGEYPLHLHYRSVEPDGGDPVQKTDYARLDWTTDSGAAETIWAWDEYNKTNGNTPPGSTSNEWGPDEWRMVTAGTSVTLWATLDDPDLILAAYVLSGGDLVPLTPTFPGDVDQNTGLEGVTENASLGDNALADALATFEMPNGETHVYLVTTNQKPCDEWHTVILTASDTSSAGNDLGRNQGFLNTLGATEDKKQTVYSFGGVDGPDGEPGHAFLTLPEYQSDGVTLNYFTVDTLPAPGYTVNRFKTRTVKNTPVYVQNPAPSSVTPNYYYEEPVGSCNKVFHLVFESAEDLELVVQIDDPDNPGNGTVENKLVASHTGVPDLALASESMAGSYQIMTGVTPGGAVGLAVTPHPGYKAYAFLYTDGAPQPTQVPLSDPDNDGVLNGAFDMPGNKARVVVTFYLPYQGTLVLVDNANANAQARMTESTQTAPASVSVSQLKTSDTLYDLPNGTLLDAQVTAPADLVGRKVTGLLTTGGSTTLLPARDEDGVKHYRHTIDRADATITLVVDETSLTGGEEYVAAVETVNRPSTVAAPTIANLTDDTKAKGEVWTSADQNDSIQVHVTVPEGYTVRVTAQQADGGAAVTLTGVGDGGSLANTGEVTFSMPAADVQVRVEYLRTHYRLTLHITQPAGTDNQTHLTATSVLSGNSDDLSADGAWTYAQVGTDVDLTAQADTAQGVTLKSIFYQYSDGTYASVTFSGDSYTSDPELLTMPAADVDVTVIYAKTWEPGPDPTPEPDPEGYFIATAVKALGPGVADHPDNQILSIQNRTRTAKTDGSPLPQASPAWTAGYAGDAVQVAYQAAPGYVVTVTARRADDNQSLPVLQMGYSQSGTATAAFPDPGADIIITVTYTTDPPARESHDAALQLVEHDGKKGNWAQTTDYPDDILHRKDVSTDPLALDGTYSGHPPTYTAPLPTDPVEMLGSETYAGDDLRTLAKWAADSSVTRMTVAVRNTDTNAETGEVDLPLTYYVGTVTSRAQTPVLNENEIVVLRVYYGNLYQATLHVVGAGAGDVTEATDDRPDTITSVEGADRIHNSDERLEDLRGGEIVQTTAKPDKEGASGAEKRLVGVVYESDSMGAWPAQPNEDEDDRYDFTMPQDNVDFYVVYEEEPADPKDRSYIAKVQLDGDSAPIAGTDNALSIRNDNDADVAKGKYWVAAKGGDSVTVNVKVAQGYRAQILYTKADDASATVLDQLPQVLDPTTQTLRHVQAGDAFHYYISRTQFAANLPEGRDATFTMPAGTDATVTVKFTKGYDLTLDVQDATGLTAEEDGTNQAELTYGDDPEAHLSWTNDGTDQTYDPADHTLKALEGGKDVKTTVTPYDADVKVKVLRDTPFTGTQTRKTGQGNVSDNFPMPYEDTQVSVLLQDKDAKDDLLAKVELVGDYADINGNAAAPIAVDTSDHADPSVSHSAGQVWTTTCQGDQLDVTLTVARGYVARIKVRRDNKNYTDNPNDPTRWDYLDSDTYNFEKVWQVNGTVPPALVDADPVSLGVSGVTEVQIGYNAEALPLSPFPQSIGGPQHFRFTMVSDITDGEPACDVTVLVEFVRSTEMPRPFDPDNLAMKNIDLERGFIYGENRGDYAIIEIPTLAEVGETATTLYDTDNWDADHVSDPPKIHDPTKAAEYNVTRYIFALYDAASDTYRELVATGDNADVMLVPYDEETLADGKDLYNYILGLYHGSKTLDGAEGARDFVGSKLLLLPKPKADGTFTQRGQALYEMLNNKGSLESYAKGEDGVGYRTTLYVMAEDAGKRQSGYTPVWIRPWFALGVNVISYAPTHPLTGELYRLMTREELDQVKGVATPSHDQTLLSPDDFTNYQYNSKQAPFLTDSIVLENDAGSGKWLQLLRIRSSELLGDFTADYDPGKADLLDNVPDDADLNLTYALALRKTSNLTYRRIRLELNPKADCYGSGTELADYYLNKDPATRTFMLQDTIQLIAGDVDGNRMVKLQDYDRVYDYVYRNSPWSTVPAAPVKPGTPQSIGGPEWDAYYAAMGEWSISIYNPASTAYRVDLNGDRHLSVADLDIVRTLYNFNHTEEDYQWLQVDEKGDGTLVTPFGLGPRPSDHVLLLGLPLEGELPADPYWDQSADLDSQEGEALDTLRVDRDGNLWQGDADSEEDADPEPAEPADRPAQSQPQPGERVEIPLGGDDRVGLPQGGQEVVREPAFPDDPTPPEPEAGTPEPDPEAEAAPEDPLPELEAETEPEALPEAESDAQPETPPSEADAQPEVPPSEPEAAPAPDPEP